MFIVRTLGQISYCHCLANATNGQMVRINTTSTYQKDSSSLKERTKGNDTNAQ